MAADAVDELYQQALDLYRLGPGSADECKELLQRQIQQTPDHERSHELLAKIQMQSAEFVAAKSTAKEAISLAAKKHRISPQMMFLLARCHYETGELDHAKKQLDRCRRFFRRTGEQMWRFHELESAVELRRQRKQMQSEGGIGLFVTLAAAKRVYRQGEPILLRVLIENRLDGVVGYSTYSLKPNGWNGECAGITLVDIARNDDGRSLFLMRPQIDVPVDIAAIGSHRIEPGDSMNLIVDASKWEIVDGWIPGRYRLNVRVESLTVDGNRCVVGVHSPSTELTIVE